MRAARAISLAFAATISLAAFPTPGLACGFLEVCTEQPSGGDRAEPKPKSERWMLGAINSARTQRGASALTWDASLDALATKHAKRMAAAAEVFHNEAGLRERRARTGETLGENVGVGADLGDVHEAFLASASHRHTLLGPFARIGLGVARRAGEVYVVEVFATRPGYGTTTHGAVSANPIRTQHAASRRGPSGEPVLVRAATAPRAAAPVLAAQPRHSAANPLPWLGIAAGVVGIGIRRARRVGRWVRS